MPQLSPEKYLVKPLSARQMRDSDIIIKDQDGNSECLEVSPDFAYSSKELVSFENAAVNIDSSTDVILGPVTQFNVNGNVTIVQNGPAEGEEKEKEKTIFEQKFPEKCDSGIEFCRNFIKNRKKSIMVIFFSFTLAMSTLLLLVILLVLRDDVEPIPDHYEAPIFVSREDWGGRSPRNVTAGNIPVKIIVIKHTKGMFCLTTDKCKEITRNVQDRHFHMRYPDIMFNFLIGGDGNIYVGRGFGVRNHQSNRTIDIAIHGNFLYDTYYPNMINATKYVIREGILRNYITEDYVVVCQNQTDHHSSPAAHIWQEIIKWDHFSNKTYYDGI